MAFPGRFRGIAFFSRLYADSAPPMLQLDEDLVPEVRVTLTESPVPFGCRVVPVPGMCLLAGVALRYAFVAHVDNEKKFGFAERCLRAFCHDSTRTLGGISVIAWDKACCL